MPTRPINGSTLRKGKQKVRKRKNLKRLITIVKLRDKEGWTWERIGSRFGISRQAVFKFYKEQKKLLY